MRRFCYFALPWLALSLAVAPSPAQEIANFAVIPAVAHTAGAGIPPSYWLTDVVIHNLTAEEMTVGMGYFPFDTDNEWDASFPVTVQLEPRETFLVEDVLGSRFGITGNSKGVLLLSCEQAYFPENPEDGVMMVTTRTYNIGSPLGTYGQTVPPATLMWNGSATPSYVTGARNDERYRSNLGIVNISAERVTVHYRVLSADGSVLASGSSEIPKRSGRQWSLADLGVGKVQGPISAEMWLDPADVTPDPCTGEMGNYFVGYISKADGNPNGTGDAEYLVAVPTEFPPAGWECPDEATASRVMR